MCRRSHAPPTHSRTCWPPPSPAVTSRPGPSAVTYEAVSEPEGRGVAWTEERRVSEPEGRGVAWTEERSLSEPEGRGVAWTEERGTSDEGRRRLTAPRRASGQQSTSDEGRRRPKAPRRRAEDT